MKIRMRMILGNLAVGILPVILAIVIFTISLSSQARNQAVESIESKLQDIRQGVLDGMDAYQNYAFFFAKSAAQPPTLETLSFVTGYNVSVNVANYDLKLLQFTYGDQIVYESFYGEGETAADVAVYLAQDDFVSFIWSEMSNPINTANFKRFFTEVVDDTVVVRNCAIIVDEESNEKKGVSILSVPLDYYFLSELASDMNDTVLFIQTTNGGMNFSSEDWGVTEEQTILDEGMENGENALLNIGGAKYFVSKMNLYEETETTIQEDENGVRRPTTVSTPIADIGICIGFESMEQVLDEIRNKSILVFLLSVAVALLLAYLIARQITVPVLKLTDMTTEFERNLTEVPGPQQMRDEIDQLQKSISEMSQSIITSTNEIREKNERIGALVEQQNGDYFLTSLLIKPLVPNDVKSEFVKVDFYINQKKKFSFRKWESQLGGDICIARTITLRGRRYVAFVNGDAMGKSMQGAGGALVMGVAFNSIIEQTYSSKTAQNKSAKEWLEECYNQIEGIFESFDGSMMISCIMGLLDEQSGKLTYFNAEHPWLVSYQNGKAEFAEDETNTGKKLGTIGFSGVYICELQLAPGEVLIMGSDGKDDVKLGMDESTGLRIINEDETAFLRFAEEAEGDLNRIADKVMSFGELTDDFTMLRLSWLENPAARRKFESADAEAGEKSDGNENRDLIKSRYNDAVTAFKEENFALARDVLMELYRGYTTIDENFNVLNMLGNSYYKLGENENALRFWQEAQRLDSENKTLLHNIQVVSKKLGL